MQHYLFICNMSIPDRSAIPQKSATLSKVRTIRLHFRPPSTQLKPISIFLKGEFEAAHSRKGGTIRLHFRPPSTQLKPISIFLKGEFEAAHSRKVGTVSGDPPKTCIAPSLNPDRPAILRKSVTLLKVGICCAPRALRVGRLSCR